jgi:hypothetical protein
MLKRPVRRFSDAGTAPSAASDSLSCVGPHVEQCVQRRQHVKQQAERAQRIDEDNRRISTHLRSIQQHGQQLQFPGAAAAGGPQRALSPQRLATDQARLQQEQRAAVLGCMPQTVDFDGPSSSCSGGRDGKFAISAAEFHRLYCGKPMADVDAAAAQLGFGVPSETMRQREPLWRLWRSESWT